MLREKFQMKPPWTYLWGDDAIGPRDSSNATLVIYFSTHPLSFPSLEIKDHSSTRPHTFKFPGIISSKALKWYNKQHFHCQEGENQESAEEYFPKDTFILFNNIPRKSISLIYHCLYLPISRANCNMFRQTPHVHFSNDLGFLGKACGLHPCWSLIPQVSVLQILPPK